MKHVLNHTPGPWVVDDGTDAIDNMAGCLLNGKATDDEWVAVGTSDEGGYAESVAYCHPMNAPLIAAAPVMLNALNFSVRGLQALRDGRRGGDIMGECSSALDRILNAISTAQGVQTTTQQGGGITPATVRQIEEQWKSRARTQGLKPRSARYRLAELEFFAGAMAAMEAVTGDACHSFPPQWIVAGMRGDPIAV